MIEVISTYKEYVDNCKMRTNYIFIQDNLKKHVWFEYNIKHDELIDIDNFDSFVIALLPYVIIRGININVPGYVTNKSKTFIKHVFNVFKNNKLNKKEVFDLTCSLSSPPNKNNNSNNSFPFDFSTYDFAYLTEIEKSEQINLLLNITTDALKNDENNKNDKMMNFCDLYNYKYDSIDSNFGNTLLGTSEHVAIYNMFYLIATSTFINNYNTLFLYNKYNINTLLYEALFIENPYINNLYVTSAENLSELDVIYNLKNESKNKNFISECNSSNCYCKKCVALPINIDTHDDITKYNIPEVKHYLKYKKNYQTNLTNKRKFNFKFLKNNKRHLSLNKILNVGLVCMEETNMGDPLIKDNTAYFLKTIFLKYNIKYNIKYIDMGGNLHKLYKKNQYYDPKLCDNHKCGIPELDNLKKEKFYHWFMKYQINKVSDCEIIIFVGGGLIKYKKQLHIALFIDEILKLTNKNKIPVIFNSVGIESYDEKNKICKYIQKIINSKCVYSITTRDDYDTLKNNYITNKKIIIDKVSDPALLTNLTYNIAKKKGKLLIGINIIRFEIFNDYEQDIDEIKLMHFYKEFITLLLTNKIPFKLYTNGAHADFKTLCRIKNEFLHVENFEDYIEPLPSNAYDLVQMISKYSVVLNTRLHSSIIATSLGIPSLNMVWNNKQILFCKSCGLSKNYITHDQFIAADVYKKLINLNSQKININHDYLYSDYNSLEKLISKLIKNK